MLSVNRQRYLLWFLVATMPILGFTLDVYTPSMPVIAQYFNVSPVVIKLTIAILIFGFGIGQLIAGPISDQVGRKKVFLAALLLLVVACALAGLSTSVYMLLLMRLLQGFAISGIIVNVRAILVDTYEDAQLRRATIYTTTAYTLSPIVGPVIGSYLQSYINWQAGFYFLTFYALALLGTAVVILPETLLDRRRMSTSQILKNYLKVLSCWDFMKTVVGLALAFSILNVFNLYGPFIIQQQLGYSVLFYGHVALLVGVALLVVAPIALIGFFLGVVYPNYEVRCLNMFKESAGIATAVRGSFTMLGAGIVTTLLSFISVEKLLMLFGIYLVLTLISFIVFFFSGFNRRAV